MGLSLENLTSKPRQERAGSLFWKGPHHSQWSLGFLIHINILPPKKKKKNPSAFSESKLNTTIETHDISDLNLIFSCGWIKKRELILLSCSLYEVLLIIVAIIFVVPTYHLLWTRRLDTFLARTVSVLVTALGHQDTHFTDEQSEACNNSVIYLNSHSNLGLFNSKALCFV